MRWKIFVGASTLAIVVNVGLLVAIDTGPWWAGCPFIAVQFATGVAAVGMDIHERKVPWRVDRSE
jgi:hydrogenase/urease accessory protein HupE